jgi:hypothetical protein
MYALAHGALIATATVVSRRVAAPELAPVLPLSDVLTAAPDDIGGPEWTQDGTALTLTALETAGTVRPWRAVQSSFNARVMTVAEHPAEAGESYVVAAVMRPVAGDRVGVGLRTTSANNFVRARVVANVLAGDPSYSIANTGDPSRDFMFQALCLERLARGFVRLSFLMTRSSGGPFNRMHPFWSAGGDAQTVDGWRCGLFRMARPEMRLAAVSPTQIAIRFDPSWEGWAAGATCEFRVNGGAPVAALEPGVHLASVAGPGTHTVERRERWPAAALPGLVHLPGGGSSITLGWGAV